MSFNIRKRFCSRYGKEGILAEFDFSQLEVAALAEISDDLTLLHEVNNGIDIHTENAAIWKKCHPSAVSKDIRKKAKIMTFQLQYGASANKMAESLGIPKSEAQNFIYTFYDKYKGVSRFHEELVCIRDEHQKVLNKQTIGQEASYISLSTFSPTGREYRFPAKFDKERERWYYSLTEMKNYPVQGFATGDIVPIVINMVNRGLYSKENCCLINTVHDSFVIDCEAEVFIDVLKLVEEVFTEFPIYFQERFDYALKAVYNYDVKFGWNLFEDDMKKLTREEVQSL